VVFTHKLEKRLNRRSTKEILTYTNTSTYKVGTVYDLFLTGRTDTSDKGLVEFFIEKLNSMSAKNVDKI